MLRGSSSPTFASFIYWSWNFCWKWQLLVRYLLTVIMYNIKVNAWHRWSIYFFSFPSMMLLLSPHYQRYIPIVRTCWSIWWHYTWSFLMANELFPLQPLIMICIGIVGWSFAAKNTLATPHAQGVWTQYQECAGCSVQQCCSWNFFQREICPEVCPSHSWLPWTTVHNRSRHKSPSFPSRCIYLEL